MLLLSQSCGFAVAGAGPPLYRFPPSMSTWSDSAWQWGSATGEAHRAAAQLRRSLGTAEARAAFLASVCSGEADWSTCELALALKCQHAAKRCYGKATDHLMPSPRSRASTLRRCPLHRQAHGLGIEAQSSWRELTGGRNPPKTCTEPPESTLDTAPDPSRSPSPLQTTSRAAASRARAARRGWPARSAGASPSTLWLLAERRARLRHYQTTVERGPCRVCGGPYL